MLTSKCGSGALKYSLTGNPKPLLFLFTTCNKFYLRKQWKQHYHSSSVKYCNLNCKYNWNTCSEVNLYFWLLVHLNFHMQKQQPTCTCFCKIIFILQAVKFFSHNIYGISTLFVSYREHNRYINPYTQSFLIWHL